MVQVKNLLTGCSATVRINDRGPYRKSRVIDVSKAAAQQLQMIQSGTAKVEFYVIK
jgi:rare lipoprotein A